MLLVFLVSERVCCSAFVKLGNLYRGQAYSQFMSLSMSKFTFGRFEYFRPLFVTMRLTNACQRLTVHTLHHTPKRISQYNLFSEGVNCLLQKSAPCALQQEWLRAHTSLVLEVGSPHSTHCFTKTSLTASASEVSCIGSPIGCRLFSED